MLTLPPPPPCFLLQSNLPLLPHFIIFIYSSVSCHLNSAPVLLLYLSFSSPILVYCLSCLLSSVLLSLFLPLFFVSPPRLSSFHPFVSPFFSFPFHTILLFSSHFIMSFLFFPLIFFLLSPPDVSSPFSVLSCPLLFSHPSLPSSCPLYLSLLCYLLFLSPFLLLLLPLFSFLSSPYFI